MKKIIIAFALIILSGCSINSNKKIAKNVESQIKEMNEINKSMEEMAMAVNNSWTDHLDEVYGEEDDQIKLESREKKEIIPSGKITDINLQKVVLENLEKKSWSDVNERDLKGILSLNAFKKGIKDISGIGKLINLEYTDMGSNEIETIPDEIGNLIDLGELHLNNNNISNISPEISNFGRLSILDISGNNIKKLPKEIGKMTNLRTLDLSSNKLEEVPNEIGNLNNLKYLNLSGNKLNEITSKIGNLIKLETLYLNYNELFEIPEEVGSLIQLENLSLNNNKLSEIPSEIGNLKKLNNLTIKNNSIVAIPLEVKNLIESEDFNTNTINIEGNIVTCEEVSFAAHVECID